MSDVICRAVFNSLNQVSRERMSNWNAVGSGMLGKKKWGNVCRRSKKIRDVWLRKGG